MDQAWTTRPPCHQPAQDGYRINGEMLEMKIPSLMFPLDPDHMFGFSRSDPTQPQVRLYVFKFLKKMSNSSLMFLVGEIIFKGVI